MGLKWRVQIVMVARSWLATLHPSRNTWGLTETAIALTRPVLILNSHAAVDWYDFAQLKGVAMKTAISTWQSSGPSLHQVSFRNHLDLLWSLAMSYTSNQAPI